MFRVFNLDCEQTWGGEGKEILQVIYAEGQKGLNNKNSRHRPLHWCIAKTIEYIYIFIHIYKFGIR